MSVPPASKFLRAQKPVAHALNPVRSNVMVPQMGLKRRQPSQDFRPVIGDRNVMILLHVRAASVAGKRDCIMILEAGCIKKRSVLYFRELAVLIEILYLGGFGLWRDLVLVGNKARI